MPETRQLILRLSSHVAYMQGELEAYHQDSSESFYWYREAVALRQQVADALVADALAADEPAVPTERQLLQLAAEFWPADCEPAQATQFARAALARWGRPTPEPAGEHQAAPVPVAVSERLPEPSVKVLAHYLNGLGKGRTICAIWVPAKTRSDGYHDDDYTEYDEESDAFYWPEGWYEAIENWDDFGYVRVDEGEVIYWQTLPTWPAHALPLPSGEVQA